MTPTNERCMTFTARWFVLTAALAIAGVLLVLTNTTAGTVTGSGLWLAALAMPHLRYRLHCRPKGGDA